jgi:hypothetical protein
VASHATFVPCSSRSSGRCGAGVPASRQICDSTHCPSLQCPGSGPGVSLILDRVPGLDDACRSLRADRTGPRPTLHVENLGTLRDCG